MSYSIINSHRIAYDIDGTGVVKTNTDGLSPIWADTTKLVNLNAQNPIAEVFGTNTAKQFDVLFFFPTKKNIMQFYWQMSTYNVTVGFIGMYGSNDTTNGLDGTWETATIGKTTFPSTDIDGWRKDIINCNFSESKKVIKMRFSSSNGSYNIPLYIVHLYGQNDIDYSLANIVFCDELGNEYTTLKDWGNRPENSSLVNTIYLKNNSANKIANNINISINHIDFLLSLDNTTWTTSVHIDNLNAETMSQPIYIKNTIGAIPQILGIRQSQLVATVSSWV